MKNCNVRFWSKYNRIVLWRHFVGPDFSGCYICPFICIFLSVRLFYVFLSLPSACSSWPSTSQSSWIACSRTHNNSQQQ